MSPESAMKALRFEPHGTQRWPQADATRAQDTVRAFVSRTLA